MFCSNCGKELTEDARFCDSCGARQPDKSVFESAVIPESAPVEPTIVESVIPESAPVEPTIAESVIPESAPVEPTIAESAIPESAPVEPTIAESVIPESAPVEPAIAESVIPESAPVEPTIAESVIPESAPVEPTIAESVIPESAPVEPAIAESAIPEEKTSAKSGRKGKRGLAAVIIAAAVVVLFGAGFLTWTFNRASLTHTFLGDEKYAASMLRQEADNLSQYSDFTGIAAAMLGSSDSTEASIALVKELYGEDGGAVTISIDSDMSEEASELAFRNDDEKATFTALSSLDFTFGVNLFGEDILFGGDVSEGGVSLISADGILSGADGRMYFMLPAEAYGKPFYMESGIDPDILSDTGDSTASDLLEDIVKAYVNALSAADFEFDSAEMDGFKGKLLTVTISNKDLGDFFEDVCDALDDNGFGTLIDPNYASGLQDGDFKASLTITHYINSDNTLAGSTFSFKSKGDDQTSLSFSHLNTKSEGFSASVKINKSEIKLTQAKENETEGKFTLTFKSESTDTVKINISYSELSFGSIGGMKIPLGNFKISFTDDENNFGRFIGRLTIDRINISSRMEGNDLIQTYTLKNTADDAEITVNYTFAKGFSGEKFDTSAAVDFEDSSNANEITASVIEHYLDIWEESRFANEASVNGSPLVDYIKTQFDQLNREKLLTQNYSAYSDDTVYFANSYAAGIFNNVSNMRSNITLTDSEPYTVKLYFDKDGKLEVIDNKVLSDEIINVISQNVIQCAYVEIVLQKGRNSYGICGVSVTMTDDKNNIPANLPNNYSFLDGEYPWGDSDSVNFIGGFVVGTSSTLRNGTGGTTEENDKALIAKVSEYDDLAKRAYEAFNKFVGDNEIEFSSSYTNRTLVLYMNNNDWNVSGLGLSSSQSDAFKDYIGTQIPGVENNLYIYITLGSGGKAVGAFVSDYGTINMSAALVSVGETTYWDFAEGVSGSFAVGTYPKIKSFDGTLSISVINKMTGEWTSGSKTVTLTAEDFAGITQITPYNSSYISVTLANGEVYIFDLDGKMVYNNSTYTKE